MDRPSRTNMVRPGTLATRIARGIATRRKALGITQDELRERLERRGVRIARNTVAHHEGGGALTTEQLGAYALALECPPSALLASEAEPTDSHEG